ncbi:Uncharacterized protein conserved in bacteria (DUF2263) [Seminavis robusta]|uniref:Uncharacterized protein conserved in bacteria (DUF2263) n=1 Tax=Seminavis robusta TaxID=568900 RepID=A0A9N8ECG2_9STRA|nr:Uncharacterized protein conserved in bacteria (DUF2263) [Seminavis robusta]|eukprot:Sro798_g204010.1 Uncharacterized protein conserved in bacteria (DUF2263) (303) ;mRNA; f:20415-21323
MARTNKQQTKQPKPLQGQARNPVANETIKMLLKGQVSPNYKNDASSKRRLAAALQSAQLIPDTRMLPIPARYTATTSPQVILYRGGSWEAAEWVLERLQQPHHRQYYPTSDNTWGKPVVLDYASDSNPGGCWRGNQYGTQEEHLCRTSSLGLSLERLQLQLQRPYSIPTHGCVYVQDVAVLLCESTGHWRNRPLWCSVIAAALRNADNHKDFIQAKVRGVVAAASGHGALVGGAWGCGAFGNDTADVAEAWRVAALRAPSDMAFLVMALPNKEAFAVFRQVFPDSLVIDPQQPQGNTIKRRK